LATPSRGAELTYKPINTEAVSRLATGSNARGRRVQFSRSLYRSRSRCIKPPRLPLRPKKSLGKGVLGKTGKVFPAWAPLLKPVPWAALPWFSRLVAGLVGRFT
jgi:hypothetical protein